MSLHSAVLRLISGLTGILSPVAALAQRPVFDGGGIPAGLESTAGVTGVSNADPRTAIVDILVTILNFAALLATVMIIIAGFYLVLSLGSEDNKDKAKRIIYYTLIGLVVILFSRILVSLVTVLLASQV